MKPSHAVRYFSIKVFIQKWSTHCTWIHSLYGPKVTNQRNFTLLIKITKETITDYQNNIAIQCISSILMKYYPKVISHFMVSASFKINFHTVNHRVPWDSSRRHEQENSSQRKQLQNHRNRFLFRYATWNYLYSSGTPRGTLQWSSARVYLPGQTKTAQTRDLASPGLRNRPPNNQKQCSQVLSRIAPAETILGSEILLWTAGYLLSTKRWDAILPAGKLNAMEKNIPRMTRSCQQVTSPPWAYSTFEFLLQRCPTQGLCA